MKLIAVSQRVDVIRERDERRDALDQRISAWLLAAGYMPVPVPNLLYSVNSEEGYNALLMWLQAVSPVGVILSGGNDIGECPERDETERCLLQWAMKNIAPVLGICRGMQMMSVSMGGSLKLVDGHVCTRHALHGPCIIGEVNSYHNYSLENCPPEFTVLAESEDSEIEAIRHVAMPWEGWMWHPEREAHFEMRDISRLKGLFK